MLGRPFQDNIIWKIPEPENFSFSRTSSSILSAYWKGPKPAPPKPRLEGGASLPFDPTSVVKESGAGAFTTRGSDKMVVKAGASDRPLLDTEILYLQGYPRNLDLRDPALPQARGADSARTTALRLPSIYAVSLCVWLAAVTRSRSVAMAVVVGASGVASASFVWI